MISGIPGIGGLSSLTGPDWSVGSISGLGSVTGQSAAASGTGGPDSFSSALTNAIGSLNASQNTASTATLQLADGEATSPTAAVTAVENASLSMDYASQIRNQLDSAAQTIFQTQM